MEKNGNSLIFKNQTIFYNDRPILSYASDKTFAFIGRGTEQVKMYRGNFDIQDYVESRVPLNHFEIAETNEAITFNLSSNGQTQLLQIRTELDKFGRLVLKLISKDKTYNRLWLRLPATAQEKIYGCGEQLSYFNLRGNHFPLWTSEPGIGRNKSTLTTFKADTQDNAGGDYYTTNFPEPTFISTQKYYCHTNSFVYVDFDFRNPEFHELQYWGIPESIVFETADTYNQLLGKLTNLLGHQPILPNWTDEGLLLGIQGGTQRTYDTVDKLRAAGVKIAGVFCQDWEGTRQTSFGKRNFWNWEWNPALYPGLDTKIHEWKDEGIRFLSYINPYLVDTSALYAAAAKNGYFAKNSDGSIYLVDFGEFNCGVVDFTNPAAFDWFKELIKTNLIDFGCDGWMADFGEYLPTDVVLFDGSDPMIRHNEWPALWAKCNHDAVAEAGKTGQIVYFMRAGATGSQRYCPMLWAGDQSVNWSLDDGIASTIPAALSVGMTGMGLTHSDIGGYTSMHGNVRSKELFMRWAEMSAFTSLMRSHEGNRPAENFQVWDDDDAIQYLAKFTDVFQRLAPYRRTLVAENNEYGLPVQRPLFLEYENDSVAYDIQYEYLFGSDMLVVPVYQETQTDWDVYLPDDEWIHLWSGQEFHGGHHTVAAPLGEIPVFYRKKSEFRTLFTEITNQKYSNY
ncbi:alpha-glucosidase [Paucilactobacillus nenjiangensis]|uniref:Alpha-glucosidase n=1 Tax=Paucilactobacillus nenjiangensis TaxID=1296540 RepID=A0A5P1WZM2_9LACO|nr:alpha-glucosidase [Paucilactobacillus nenjiangensis]QER67092.1 alpha-glucosidase [Paucilactobacillus nenjiangensis]